MKPSVCRVSVVSGHTADELARVLRRAGAACVEVWIVARSGHRGVGEFQDARRDLFVASPRKRQHVQA